MKVFWSWQSDTPGKTGRHFVREALDAAVEILKEPSDVEEPTQRDLKEDLHVDSDRQGVPGSPDLARTILAKIGMAHVFIADVTPVSTIPAFETTTVLRPEKRNMNPNVAIELGYAMHALSDERILMVLNTWYGDRTYLPFDLAHKAGPIAFHLAPGASGQEIKSAKAELVGSIVSALRPYLAAPSKRDERPTTVGATPTVSRAAYYAAGEELAAFGERSQGDRQVYAYDDGRGLYVRLRPKFARAKPLSPADMNEFARAQRIPLIWHGHRMSLGALNRYGAIVLEPKGPKSGEIEASTQLFPSGELWGLNRRLLTITEAEHQLPGTSIENVFRHTIAAYVDFMRRELDIPPPFLLEVGAVGIEGYSIVVNPYRFESYGPIMQNEYVFEREINAVSDEATEALIVSLHNEFFELSGYRRPA